LGRRNPTPKEAKAAVLGFANVVAGVLDVLGELSDGAPAGKAVKKAVRRTRARGKALHDAERAVARLDAKDDES
jgi:hypothetical protein